MATIGNIQFALTAITGPMEAGFARADKIVQGFQRSLITKFAGGQAIVRGLDTAVSALADEMERMNREGGKFDWVNVAGSLGDSLAMSVPVAGELGRLVAQLSPDMQAWNELVARQKESEQISIRLAAINKAQKAAGRFVVDAQLKLNIVNAQDEESRIAAELEASISQINRRANERLNEALSLPGIGREQAGAIRTDIEMARSLEEQAARAKSAAESVELYNRKMKEMADANTAAIKSGVRLDGTLGMIADAMTSGLLQAQKHYNDMVEEAARIHDEMRTPLEAYNDELARLAHMLQLGVLGQEDYARAVQAAQDVLKSLTQTRDDMMRGPDLIERRITAGFPNVPGMMQIAKTADEQIAAATEKQLAEDKKHTRQNDQIRQAIIDSAANINVVEF